jgi:hypothetical protein
LDSAFGLNVQKSSVDVGMGFRKMLDSAGDGRWSMKDYIRDAVATYRATEAAPKDGPLVPGVGLPYALRRMALKHMANGKAPARPVAMAWRRLGSDEIFRIERDPPRLLLNRKYQADLDGGQDGALIKLLMFLSLRDEFGRERIRAPRAEWLEALNAMLLVALGRRS